MAPDAGIIAHAAEVLRRGGVVAFPTETVYGLGADALNAEAVGRVFAAKGRPADNPLIVHIENSSHLEEVCAHIPTAAIRLADVFWPGPLTLVVRRQPAVPDIVTAGQETVAVRMPNHRVPLELIRTFGRGIVGPSANISGRPSPTTAAHVFDDLDGKIDLILDAGPTEIGLESTVVDVTDDDAPAILRFGGISQEHIEEVLGMSVRTPTSGTILQHSPGTRHRHYAPQARVLLIPEGDAGRFAQAVERCRAEGLSLGCIFHSEQFTALPGIRGLSAIPLPLAEYGKHLFASMRKLDASHVDVIIVETVPATGIGAAIMDRLRRAAEERN